MKKKCLRALISLAMILLLAAPAMAFGYTKSGEGTAVLLQEGRYDIVQAAPAKKSAALRSATGTDAAIYDALMAMDSSIDLTAFSISVNDIGAIYGNVINANPDLFFVGSGFGYNYYPSTGCVAYLSPQYTMTAAEKDAAMAQFLDGAQEALATVDDSMDAVQKALTLHDYICSEATYPVLQINAQGQVLNDEHDWHTALGFFRDKVAVCAGYSLAYEYLLHQLGIECVYVGSDAMSHAWNLVKIGGSWYNVDITFDNHDNAQGQNTVGSMRHKHFLKSDSFLTSEAGSCHYGGTTYEGYAAGSTAYDGAFWDDLPCSRIYVVDGDYYYLKPNNGSYGMLHLTRRTKSGTETKLGSFFSTSYLNYTSYAFDENGTRHDIPYTDSLARLTYLDNRFYVVAGNWIYAKLPDGSRAGVTTTNGNYCNGFGVNEKGNLIWQPYSDSTTVNEVNKKDYFKNYFEGTDGTYYHVYPDVNLDGRLNAKDFGAIVQKNKN